MAFSDPKKNLEQLGIPEGAHIADFGSGTGFYTLAAARKVGSEGRVYAIDVQRDLLSLIAAEAVDEEIGHVEVIWGDIGKDHGTHLRDGLVDIVLVSNVLFQVESVDAVFQEARRVLRPGGRLLVVEWSDSFGGLGPKQEHVVSEGVVREALEVSGFNITGTIDAGDHHYGLVAQRPRSG